MIEVEDQSSCLCTFWKPSAAKLDIRPLYRKHWIKRSPGGALWEGEPLCLVCGKPKHPAGLTAKAPELGSWSCCCSQPPASPASQLRAGYLDEKDTQARPRQASRRVTLFSRSPVQIHDPQNSEKSN